MKRDIVPDAELDCIGLYCPMPIALTREKIEAMNSGQILKILTDDPAAEEDIQRWAKRTGHELLHFQKENTHLTFYIRKRK